MNIIMPKMGESINEGTIIKWHKKVGDQVNQDEIIFEISTDKVDTEIPSPASGVISEIKYKEGDTVEVGTVVAVLDSNRQESQPASAEKIIEVKKEIIETKSPSKEKKVAQLPSSSESDTINIEMPKMGESVMEGTIIKWHKKVGEKVAKDETLFEISTDKVDTEVPSSVAGIVAEILIGEQETVGVGTVVAKISTSGKISASEKTFKAELNANSGNVKEVISESQLMHDNFKPHDTTPKVQGTGSGFYSPLVMNIAQKENVSFDELKNITGTGLQGRVTKIDILSYIANKKSSKKETFIKKVEPVREKTAAPSPSFVPSDDKPVMSGDGIEKIPMDNIRQRIMDHMVASRDTSVHVSAMLEVDMTRIHNFINENKENYQQNSGVKLTYMAFIAQSCIKALRAYPLVNSTLDGNTILKKYFINLGIAVAIEPNGLIVPNIKGADQLSLTGLAKAINDIAYRSRNKKLMPDDISGGTFTITNYGVFGTIFGTPIINQPEVAILGVGAVIKKPVVISVDGTDSIAIRPVMALTLSHDHRLVDGMLGGMFLKHIKDSLENFDAENL